MESYMSDFVIPQIGIYEHSKLDSNGVLLWVWHADKIPPHIGLSTDGHYFSLKANGKDEHLSINRILELIQRKSIPTLCFHLDYSISMNDITRTFDQFTVTVPNDITCLQPIKDVLNIPHAGQLTDLLIELYAQNHVRSVVGFNLPEDFNGIKQYSPEDIHERLTKLARE